MICPECGHENPENALFCAACGSKLDPSSSRPTGRLGDFKKALIITGIGGAALSLMSFGILVLPFLIGGIIAAIVYAIKGRGQIAAGIIAGIGVGIMAFVVTCFALVNTIV